MQQIPDLDAWVVFGQISSVLIFLGAVVGALWKLGLLKKSGRGGPARRSSGDATDCDILMLRDDLEVLEKRVVDVDSRTPRPDAMGRIHSRLDELNKRVAHLEGELGSANRSLLIIQEYLINRS